VSAITKEGIEVFPGQLWRDLDKRMDGRTLEVWLVNGGYAFMKRRNGAGKMTKIAISRMHKSSTGWALVQP